MTLLLMARRLATAMGRGVGFRSEVEPDVSVASPERQAMIRSATLMLLLTGASLLLAPDGSEMRGSSGGSASVAPAACAAARQRTLVKASATAGSDRLRALGERLFNDVQLSSDRTVSCASCHQSGLAFTEGRARAVGVHRREGRRNTPTLVNTAYSTALLWDGRADSLEDQAELALRDPNEMDMSEALLRRRVQPYRDQFRSALGRDPDLKAVAAAIAAYVRTIQQHRSRVDRYLYCGDETALSVEEKRGLELFSGPANCVRCHVIAHSSVHPFGGQVALFTDQRFHNIGAGRSPDPGRAGVTGRKQDRGAFKTPTLRDVARTGPYMHDGSIRTLAEVVAFYNRGGAPVQNLDRNIRPLFLTAAEQRALIAFLKALSSE